MAYKPKKRESILRAAAEVFSQQGYHSATTAEIAVKAGIPPGSIYYHISTKEQLLFDVLMDGVEAGLQIMRDAQTKFVTPVERLHYVIARTIKENCDMHNPGMALNFAFVEPQALEPAHWKKYVAARDKYERGLRNIVEDGVTKGVFSTSDVALEAKFILSLMNWIRVWYKPGGRLSGDQLAKWCSERLIAGRLFDNPLQSMELDTNGAPASVRPRRSNGVRTASGR